MKTKLVEEMFFVYLSYTYITNMYMYVYLIPYYKNFTYIIINTSFKNI